jgi:metal-responsive CopG/Arc/MetJ family transcriptional regulator
VIPTSDEALTGPVRRRETSLLSELDRLVSTTGSTRSKFHLDHDRCLEVIVMRGTAGRVGFWGSVG